MSKTCDRGLQNRELLEKLLTDVSKARDELEPSPMTSRRPRLVLKIAPDLQESQIIEIANVIRNSAIDGVIVSNTTITRPSSLTDRKHSPFVSCIMLIAFVDCSQQIGGGWSLRKAVEALFATSTANAPRTPAFECSDYRVWWYLVWCRCTRVCPCRGIFGTGVHRLWV